MADFEIPRYIQDAVFEAVSNGNEQPISLCYVAVKAALIVKEKHDATNEVVGAVRKDLLCKKCGELAKLLEECCQVIPECDHISQRYPTILIGRIEAALEPWRNTESEVR